MGTKKKNLYVTEKDFVIDAPVNERTHNKRNVFIHLSDT